MGISGALVLARDTSGDMEILCDGRSRSELAFGGSLRVMDFTLSNCYSAGIRHIAVVVDKGSHAIWPYIRQWHLAGGDEHDIQILEPEGTSYNGTIGALHRNRDFIERLEDETILVLCADKIYKTDYRLMVAAHENSGAEVTIGAVPISYSDQNPEMTIYADPEGRIVGFDDAARPSARGLIPMGCYIFNRARLLEYLRNDASRINSSHSLHHSLPPSILSNSRARSYLFEGYWGDILNTVDYYTANIDCVTNRSLRSYNHTAGIHNPFSKSSPLVPVTAGNIKNSIIGKGCVIEGYVENSIISPGVRVDRHAEVWDSVIMAGVSIGNYSVIDHCIIDEACRIGSQCYLGLGSNFNPYGNNVTVLGRRVTVPSNTSIGRNCRVLPDTGPSDFPNSVLPAGSILQPNRVLSGVLS